MKLSPKLRNFLLLAAATQPLGTAYGQFTSGTANWTGAAGGDWTTASGWSTSPNVPVTGEGPTTSRAIRINLNNGASNTLIYSAAQGHTIYTGDGTNRALASSTVSGGSMTITGGIFDSRGSSDDILGTGSSTGSGAYTLTIAGGQYINTNGGSSSFRLGFHGARTSTLNVNSGSFTAGSVIVGDNSNTLNQTGIINLNGGVATISGFARTNTNKTGTINFNGGTLRARADNAAFINSNINVANILAGGAKIDSNGFAITIARTLTGSVGDGGLEKLGAGTLSLTGANTYNGATTVSTGTLSLASGASIANSSSIVVGSGATLNVSAVSGFTVGATQTLSGTGTLAGNVIIAGSLNPGNSPGILTFENNLTLNSTSTTTMEIVGLNRGTEYDGIDVGGDIVYGGALVFDLQTLFGVGTHVFNLFDTLGSTSGDFASVALSGLYGSESFSFNSGVWSASTNAGNQSWTFTQSTGDLTLTVIPEPTTALLAGLGLLALLRRRRS